MSKMTGMLVLPKDQEIVKPDRRHDYVSPRVVYYWFAPDWVRHSPGKKNAFGRLLPVRSKESGNVSLHALSKAGNLTYVRGRIQSAFLRWYNYGNKDIKVWNEDMSFDCLILDEDPRDVLEINWDMKKK